MIDYQGAYENKERWKKLPTHHYNCTIAPVCYYSLSVCYNVDSCTSHNFRSFLLYSLWKWTWKRKWGFFFLFSKLKLDNAHFLLMSHVRLFFVKNRQSKKMRVCTVLAYNGKSSLFHAVSDLLSHWKKNSRRSKVFVVEADSVFL